MSEKEFSSPDVFVKAVASLRAGQGIRMEKDNECDFLAFRFQEVDLLNLAADESKFHIICQHTRPGADYFFQYLEQTYFEPDTELSAEYEFRIYKWIEDMPFFWSIASIPLAKKDLAFKTAEITNMRLADGVPFTVPPIVAASRANNLPKFISDDATWFPMNCERAFTLETNKGNPMYEGKGGEQDAFAEMQYKVQQLLDGKYGPGTFAKYRKRCGADVKTAPPGMTRIDPNFEE